MPLNGADGDLLAHASTLAQAAIGLSDPNPRVGCVIHDAQGRPIGEGHTQQAGGPHAEVMALRAAQAAGGDTTGGTAWVTLEPCAHHGRTPPCCDALIAARLARVVVGCVDPYVEVAGQGIARLRAAGIQVDVLDDARLRRELQALNIGFFSRVTRGRPWVRAKVAMSLDARTALPDGRSQWITGPAARADGHAWRKRAGAVLTGAGTVRDDDPRMDVREVPTTLQPLRVVLDTTHRLPLTARIHAEPGRSLVIGASTPNPQRQADYAAAGIEWLNLGVAPVDRALAESPAPEPKADGLAVPPAKAQAEADATPAAAPGLARGTPSTPSADSVDLPAVMIELARRGVNELHVEAGATLTGALWQAGLIDEWLIYQAPKLLGDGRPMAQIPVLPDLASARPLDWLEATRVGDDLRLRLQVRGADAFLNVDPGSPA